MATYEADDLAAAQDQKRVALGHLKDAWAEAWAEGVDGDCMAQASLFIALAELVSTYGEAATARYAEGLSRRVTAGEFSIVELRQ